MRDKTGREIKAGDLMKVFHYTHYTRRRKCYLYKLVIEHEGSLWITNAHSLAIHGAEVCSKCQLSDNYANVTEIISSVITDDYTDWYDRPREAASE